MKRKAKAKPVKLWALLDTEKKCMPILYRTKSEAVLDCFCWQRIARVLITEIDK